MSHVEQIHGGDRWFVFRCNSDWRKQLAAHDRLKGMGYPAYCPTREAWRFMTRQNRVKRRKVRKQFPILPGYMPIRLNLLHVGAFHDVKPDDVYRVLGVGEAPICLTDSDMAHMGRNYGGSEFVAPDHHKCMENGREFDIGDVVEVMAGPWKGHSFPVEQITGDETRTLLKLLGKDVQARFQTWELRKVA